MSILNRYVFKQLLLGFVLVCLGMVGLVWLSQSLRMIDWIVNKGVSFGLFLQLTVLVLPNFISVIMPLAFFIVLLFIYQRLFADRELIVMKAVGMSPWELCVPGIYMATLLAIFGYILTLWLIPVSVSEFKELQFKIKNDLAHVAIQEGTFNVLPDNLTVYVRVFKPSGELKGILVHDNRNPDKRVLLVAESGLFFSGGSNMRIIMNNGKRQEFDKKTNTFSSLNFEHYTMVFEEKNSGKVRSQGERERTLSDLLFMEEGQQGLDASDIREFRVEAFKRLTQPLYAYVFLIVALLPMLLGSYHRRGQNDRIYISVFSVILLQSASIGFENLAGKNLWFLIMMGLNILVPVFVGGYIFKKNSVRRKKKGILKFAVILALLILSSPARANMSLTDMRKSAPEPQFVRDDDVHKDAPVDFEADAISYNEKEQTMTASGNVILEQQGTILKADKLIFNQKTKELKAEGNVVLTRPDGVEMISEHAELSGDFKEGFIQMVQMKLADGSTFKANSVTRTDGGNIIDLDKAFYTPCTYCDGESPLWSVRAGEVTHNYKKKRFTYKNAVLKIKEIPVFYWPYLRYPDFQVKRETGFLTPSLRGSSEMSTGFDLPFFWAISDSQDLTITPTISFTHMPLVQGEYRGLFTKGRLDVSFSATKDNDDKNLAHIRADMEYDINDEFRLTGQLFRTNNETYFRRYPISHVDEQEPWIQSNLNLDYFGENTFGYARLYSFQTLRRNVSQNTLPIVPQLNYQYTTEPLWKGLYATTQINAAGVYPDTDPQSSRLSVEQVFQAPYVSDLGFVVDSRASFRIDGYMIETKENETVNTSRLYPNMSVKVRYPLMQSGENYTQILEPIVMGVWAPNSKNKEVIPNEDSADFELDDVNLFSPNRYAGYDRVEKGTRVNYGIQWAVFGNKGLSLSTLVGQSYRLKRDDTLSENSGLSDNFSSYVGRVRLAYKDVALSYRFRLSNDNLSQEMTELRLSAGRRPFSMSLSYLNLKEHHQGTGALQEREEVTIGARSQLTQNWSVGGMYRYNMVKNGGPLETTAYIQYENECMAIAFSGEKDYTEDKDYKGDTSFFVRLYLKTLGGV